MGLTPQSAAKAASDRSRCPRSHEKGGSRIGSHRKGGNESRRGALGQAVQLRVEIPDLRGEVKPSTRQRPECVQGCGGGACKAARSEAGAPRGERLG